MQWKEYYKNHICFIYKDIKKICSPILAKILFLPFTTTLTTIYEAINKNEVVYMPSIETWYCAFLANLTVYGVIFFYNIIKSDFKSHVKAYNIQEKKAKNANDKLEKIKEQKTDFIVKNIHLKKEDFEGIEVNFELENIGSDSDNTYIRLLGFNFNIENIICDEETTKNNIIPRGIFKFKFENIYRNYNSLIQININDIRNYNENIKNLKKEYYIFIIVSKNNEKLYYSIQYYLKINSNEFHVNTDKKQEILDKFGYIDIQGKTLQEIDSICNKQT